MSSWVELVESYVRASGAASAAEIATGTGLPLGFVRNALTELAPAPEGAKDPPPRAGTLISEGDRFVLGPEKPEPPPEGSPCSMTSDGGHVPTSNPLYAGGCAACGRKIGPHDPIRVPA